MVNRSSHLRCSALVQGWAPHSWVVRTTFLLGRVDLNPARSVSYTQFRNVLAQLKWRCGRGKDETWVRTAFAGVVNSSTGLWHWVPRTLRRRLSTEHLSNFLDVRGATHVPIFGHVNCVSRTGNFAVVRYFGKQSSFTHFYPSITRSLVWMEIEGFLLAWALELCRYQSCAISKKTWEVM